MPRTLIFDIESHNVEKLYSVPPEEFCRLFGYKVAGDREVTLTTDLDEMRQQIRSADCVIGHNVHMFDLRAIFGVESEEPLRLAQARKVYDTFVHATLVNPAPRMYVNRDGKNALAEKPEQMRRWFSLDEQAHRLGVPGKTHDLKALAKEFGGFGEIPVDDERFREYLVGDVEASEAVAKALLKLGPLDHYAMREQEIWARAAVISSNGVRVDSEAAQARVDELTARKHELLAWLQESYGLPAEGKSPWATDRGKEAIFAALADLGVETNHDWPRTPAGARALGGQVLIDKTVGTEAEELGQALAELKGQRSLAQLALESTHPDGFAHPEITMLQRSGRWSTTKPGLTIWTARGEGAVEKSYFIPDSEDEVLLEIDYSNADARVVAALSGDRKYAERFEPGADGHMINAVAAWGQEVVDTDPAGYRQKAKPLGHGWSYGGQARTLAKHAGVDLEDAKTFCDGMAKEYAVLVGWQRKVRSQVHNNRIYNDWGRPMYVEPGREFTQVPALHGQSGTREIVCDAILRFSPEALRHVKAQIHDAILFSVPKKNWELYRDYLVTTMETTFEPKRGGQNITLPVDSGSPGKDWFEASH